MKPRTYPLADPRCPVCQGRGQYHDWVPYGATSYPLTYICDCVDESSGMDPIRQQAEEEFDE